jgi:hypothetical protein
MSAATEQIMFNEMTRVRKSGKHSPHESNYTRLFGTPERAARTLARMCAISDGSCAGCPMYKANVEHCKSDYTHLKSIVEWLSGDAE